MTVVGSWRRPVGRPRDVDVPPAGRRLHRAGRAAAAVAGLLALAVLAACGGTAVPSPSVASSSPSLAATPRPTAWPGNAVIGIEALGVADGEIRKGINDFSRGVATEDLALMRHAADGLAGVDVLLRNADRIEIFPPMRPLAAQVREAVPAIADASRDLRAAIDAGDAEAIGTASAQLTEALTAWAELQPTLATFVNESIEQRRIFYR